MPVDPAKQLYFLNLSENNVHNNFVGLFSRLFFVTAVGSWALFHYIFKESFKNKLHSWKIQFSLFILISQCSFSGRSFFSLDFFSIMIWLGIFGLCSGHRNFNYLNNKLIISFCNLTRKLNRKVLLSLFNTFGTFN